MMDGGMVLRLNRYEYGAVLTALIEQRNERIRAGEPTDAFDDVILKLGKSKGGHWKDRERDDDEAR